MTSTESEVGRARPDLQSEKLHECIAAMDEIIATLEACCTPDNPATIDELRAWSERRTHAAEAASQLERVAIASLIQLSGTRDTPLLNLCARDPKAAAEVRSRLGRIAQLRSALALVDLRRRELLERARRVVRGYTAALFPSPEAYGRSKPAHVVLPQTRGTHA